MEWKKIYLDLVLVPPSLLLTLAYHIFLWYKVKKSPLLTIPGVNSVGRRLWVQTMIEDTDKKNILAIQTLRNMIMASTLVGTISILLSVGLAALISSTYSLKTQQLPMLLGAHHNEVLASVKYGTPLLFLLLSFFCTSLSIRFLNQVNFLINIPLHEPSLITAEYVSELFEKGCLFNTIATRILYIACPLLMWILGPVPVLLCSVALVPMLYNLDFLLTSNNGNGAENMVQYVKTNEYYRII